MFQQTRTFLVALALALVAGCSGDESSSAAPATDAAAKAESAAPAAAAEQSAPAAAAKAAEAASAATPAEVTMSYAQGAAAASLAAAGQDQPLEVCWSQSSSADKASYKIKGSTQPAPGRRAEIDQLVVVATEAPISKWENGSIVPIYAATVANLGNFSLEVPAGPKKISVCAFAPPTFDDNQNFMVAGCAAELVVGKAGAATVVEDVDLVVASRGNPLATIGGSRFGDERWTGDRVKRTVSGTIKAEGAKGFVIATGPTAILAESAENTEPVGLSAAGADGAFSLSYFAAPREPLFVCAMGFDDAKAASSLTGMGCLEVPVPEATGKEPVREFKDISLSLAAETEEMDETDKAQIALIQSCFSAS